MSYRHLAVVSILLILLISPMGAFAADHAGRSETSIRSIGLWETFRGAWSLFIASWEKEGSSLDPFGNPRRTPEPLAASEPSVTPEFPADTK